MTYEMLSLLRSLATRPSRNIVSTVQPMVDALLKAGYIANEEGSGWTASSKGCELIESTRVSPLFFYVKLSSTYSAGTTSSLNR
jgi:hypothetical protein